MGKILENLNLTLLIGLFVAIALMMAPYYAPATIAIGILQWLHVFFGVLWIGLLYYFNFVQIPTMPQIPAELKPGVSKHIAPKALFYFRWGAAFTVLTGLILAYLYGEEKALMLNDSSNRLIGIGMFPYALLSLSGAVTLCIVHKYEHNQREGRRAERNRKHEEKIARTVAVMDAERARRGHV